MDDTTPEALGSALAMHGERMAVISAEGGVIDIIAGRYSRGVPNLDVVLKGHAGDVLRVDRKSRPPEYVAHPALTLVLMAQPIVLELLGQNHVMRGRGLVARFLLVVAPSIVGSRAIPHGPDEATAAAFRQHIST